MSKLFALLRRVSFSAPERNAVAILHQNDHWIRALILQDLPATTVRVYPEVASFHLTPYLAWRFLLTLSRVGWSEVLQTGKNGVLRELYCCYLIALLDQIGARVVLTYIDNSHIFQKLSRSDRRRKYFAIQNGVRTLACVRDSLPPSPHPLSRISMSNFFCFGPRDVELFRSHGHEIDQYFPVGSVIGGYFKTSVAMRNAPVVYDLCLPSQWHAHFYSDTDADGSLQQTVQHVRLGLDGLNQLIWRLLSETELTMAICLRDNDPEERSFYEAIFGDRVVIIPGDRENFSTYRTVEVSRLAIGLNTTTLLEVFSWGHKVLWCNVPADERFQMPEAGIAYFAGTDYADFKKRVFDLLAMPQAQFAAETRSNAQFINVFDAEQPAHMIIRQTVLASLSSSST